MRRAVPFLALVSGLALLGCDNAPTTPGGTSGGSTGTGTGTAVAKKPALKHAGWWCTEHGIPEHECLMCLKSEDELKKAGDWCDQHEYAKSQCFACNPKLKERYAALYRDKYGKEPPEADENPGKPDPAPTKGEKK